MLLGRGEREQERHADSRHVPVGGVGPEGGGGGDVERVHAGAVEADGGFERDEEVGGGFGAGGEEAVEKVPEGGEGVGDGEGGGWVRRVGSGG